MDWDTLLVFLFTNGSAKTRADSSKEKCVVVAEKNKKTIREFLPISEKTRTQ